MNIKKNISKEVMLMAQETGNYPEYLAGKEASKYDKILKIAFEPDEFQKIWDACPAIAKLSFIRDTMKYVLPVKGSASDKSKDDDTGVIEVLAAKIYGQKNK